MIVHAIHGVDCGWIGVFLTCFFSSQFPKTMLAMHTFERLLNFSVLDGKTAIFGLEVRLECRPCIRVKGAIAYFCGYVFAASIVAVVCYVKM